MKTILGISLGLVTLFVGTARADSLEVELAVVDDADTPNLVLPLGDERSCATATFRSLKTHYEVSLCREPTTGKEPLVNISIRREQHTQSAQDERKVNVRAILPRNKPTKVTKLDLKDGKPFVVTATAR